jgi:hypothetical protein
MKLKIEPERFKKLLEALMIEKSKPLIEQPVLEFDETGVESKGTYSKVVGVYAKIPKSFFVEYDSKKENIAFPSSFKERFGWGFKDTEVSIHTKNNTLYMEGKKDHFDTALETAEVKDLPWKMILTDDGYIPDFNFDEADRKAEKEKPGSGKWKKGGKPKVYSSFRLDPKELILPSSKEYHFEYIDGELTVKIVDGGNFSTKIPGTAVEKKDIKFALDADYLSGIVNNLEGEVLLIFDEIMTVFVEKRKDHTKTYFLATQIEE